MTRTSKYWVLMVGSLLVTSFTACGGSDSEESSSSDSSVATGSTSGSSETSSGSSGNASVSVSEDSIVGVWLGVGYLDDELVAKKLTMIEDETIRQQLQAMAESFKSTTLGVSFNNDESYQSEMQIVSTNGDVLSGASTGNWRIVQIEGDTIVVEQTEESAPEAATSEYRFLDENHFALIPSITPDLADCNPLIVFERQAAVDLESGSEASTAQQGDGVTR